MPVQGLFCVNSKVADSISLAGVYLFICVSALSVHDGGTLLVRAEPTAVDDDVMFFAPVPLQPHDVAELNRKTQELEGVRKRESWLEKVDLLTEPGSVS